MWFNQCPTSWINDLIGSMSEASLITMNWHLVFFFFFYFFFFFFHFFLSFFLSPILSFSFIEFGCTKGYSSSQKWESFTQSLSYLITWLEKVCLEMLLVEDPKGRIGSSKSKISNRQGFLVLSSARSNEFVNSTTGSTIPISRLKFKAFSNA